MKHFLINEQNFNGALMLHHANLVMGEDNFYRASRAFQGRFKDKLVGTNEFRRFWKPNTDQNRAMPGLNYSLPNRCGTSY